MHTTKTYNAGDRILSSGAWLYKTQLLNATFQPSVCTYLRKRNVFSGAENIMQHSARCQSIPTIRNFVVLDLLY